MPTDPPEPADLVLRPAIEDDLPEVLAVFAAASQGPGQPQGFGGGDPVNPNRPPPPFPKLMVYTIDGK